MNLVTFAQLLAESAIVWLGLSLAVAMGFLILGRPVAKSASDEAEVEAKERRAA